MTKIGRCPPKSRRLERLEERAAKAAEAQKLVESLSATSLRGLSDEVSGAVMQRKRRRSRIRPRSGKLGGMYKPIQVCDYPSPPRPRVGIPRAVPPSSSRTRRRRYRKLPTVTPRRHALLSTLTELSTMSYPMLDSDSDEFCDTGDESDTSTADMVLQLIQEERTPGGLNRPIPLILDDVFSKSDSDFATSSPRCDIKRRQDVPEPASFKFVVDSPMSEGNSQAKSKSSSLAVDRARFLKLIEDAWKTPQKPTLRAISEASKTGGSKATISSSNITGGTHLRVHTASHCPVTPKKPPAMKQATPQRDPLEAVKWNVIATPTKDVPSKLRAPRAACITGSKSSGFFGDLTPAQVSKLPRVYYSPLSAYLSPVPSPTLPSSENPMLLLPTSQDKDDHFRTYPALTAPAHDVPLATNTSIVTRVRIPESSGERERTFKALPAPASTPLISATSQQSKEVGSTPSKVEEQFDDSKGGLSCVPPVPPVKSDSSCPSDAVDATCRERGSLVGVYGDGDDADNQSDEDWSVSEDEDDEDDYSYAAKTLGFIVIVVSALLSPFRRIWYTPISTREAGVNSN